jgi:ABC-2 type transport system permease protein
VVVLVAAAALAFDAQRESAAFLRTRVRSIWQLLLPTVAVNVLAAVGAFALGALAAWYETAVLLGGLPAAGTLAGIAYVAVYLAFAVALTALAAALLRGVVGTALAALLLLGLVESLGILADWLPSHLVGSLHALAGGGDLGEYLPAAAVTLALGAAAVAAATWRLGHRDV